MTNIDGDAQLVTKKRPTIEKCIECGNTVISTVLRDGQCPDCASVIEVVTVRGQPVGRIVQEYLDRWQERIDKKIEEQRQALSLNNPYGLGREAIVLDVYCTEEMTLEALASNFQVLAREIVKVSPLGEDGAVVGVLRDLARFLERADQCLTDCAGEKSGG